MSDDVKGLGHIGCVDQIVDIRPQIIRKRLARGQHQGRKAASQKFDRLAFQFTLPALISAEDRTRRGAKGTLIEEGDRRGEKKVAAKSKHHLLHPVPRAGTGTTPQEPGLSQINR